MQMEGHRNETGENVKEKYNQSKLSGLVGNEIRNEKLGQGSLVNFTSCFCEAEMKQKQK